ncbi:hypothetical protein SteCoe_36584 [Stentor coeruleus]|uniref:Uncharacterized protein n=1 Tax=Stentor coeruleus TaxID=5963 RepID=A0A1R2APW8_9CILI|nr:hypothetical protein SteCoe_36584 [Stentor coeruleus]
MEDKLSLGIEYGFLGMAVISSFTCLVRTDFNFAFALLCYYLWYTAKDEQREPIGKKLMLLNGVLLILDLVWLLAVGGSWSSYDVLGKHSGIHSFALTLSWINWLLRAGILVALGMIFKNVLKEPKSLISGEVYDMNPVS